MSKFLLLLLIMGIYSCKNNAALKELNLNPIKIPTSLNITFNGKDSVISNFFESEFKFIVYTNSTGCTSCNISKMYLWEPLMNYANSLKKTIRFIFIFYPNIEEINTLLTSFKTYSLNYPILIDENGDFEKMNPHLPKNKAMHTFLLDENNKVIFVGNPLYNKEIEKLFYKKTQELLSK